MDACPHCGVKLPAVVDAFCPECRESLSEPTVHEDPSVEDKTADRSDRVPVRSSRRATAVGAVVGFFWAVARVGAHTGEGPAYVAGYVCGSVLIGGLIGTFVGFLWSTEKMRTKP